MEKEKGGEWGGRSINSHMSLSSQMKVCLGTGFHPSFSTSLPSFLSCPSTSLVPSISASLSRSIHGRRVWMWIEQQIRSVLIMPMKGGLGEHLSLAPSRNGRSPGSWSPPLLPSRHCHSYQHHQAWPAPPHQDPWTPEHQRPAPSVQFLHKSKFQHLPYFFFPYYKVGQDCSFRYFVLCCGQIIL